MERILAATVALKADAIHPFWLSVGKCPVCAKLCAECNIAFIRASAEIINRWVISRRPAAP